MCEGGSRAGRRDRAVGRRPRRYTAVRCQQGTSLPLRFPAPQGGAPASPARDRPQGDAGGRPRAPVPSGALLAQAAGPHTSGAAIVALLGDAGFLASLGRALALGKLHLNLAQHYNNLLRANLPTSGHSGLLWFELMLSISSAQEQPVRSLENSLFSPAGGVLAYNSVFSSRSAARQVREPPASRAVSGHDGACWSEVRESRPPKRRRGGIIGRTKRQRRQEIEEGFRIA
jgi:hypothetical protein